MHPQRCELWQIYKGTSQLIFFLLRALYIRHFVWCLESWFVCLYIVANYQFFQITPVYTRRCWKLARFIAWIIPFKTPLFRSLSMCLSYSQDYIKYNREGRYCSIHWTMNHIASCCMTYCLLLVSKSVTTHFEL